MHNCCTQYCKNRPDSFPPYPPDNHHCSDDVYLREGGYATGLLSVCPVCNVGVLWPNSWMDQNVTWYGGRRRPRHIVLDGDPSLPTERGTAAPPPFWPMSIVSKWLDGSGGTEVALGPGDVVLDGDTAPTMENSTAAPPHFSAHFALALSPISATAELLLNMLNILEFCSFIPDLVTCMRRNYFSLKEFNFIVKEFYVVRVIQLLIVVSDASPGRLRSFFAVTQSVKISPGDSEDIEISFIPFSPGTCQCALILSDDSVGELLYLVNGNAKLPLPEEIPMLNNSPSNIFCILFNQSVSRNRFI